MKLLFAFVFAWLSLSTVALAQPRVVVAPFTGTRAARVRTEAVVALSREDTIDLVPSSAWSDAVSDLGEAPMSPAQHAALAGHVGADAILEGDVTRRGRRIRIDVVLRSGTTGEPIAEASYHGRGIAGARAALRVGLRRDLRNAIGQLEEALAVRVPTNPYDAPLYESERVAAQGNDEEEDEDRPRIDARVLVRDFGGPGGDEVTSAVRGALDAIDADEAAAIAQRSFNACSGARQRQSERREVHQQPSPTWNRTDRIHGRFPRKITVRGATTDQTS